MNQSSGQNPAGTIVAFCMPQRGHLQRLLPVLEQLARQGADLIMMTHVDFCAEVEATGARHFDLFGPLPIEDADAESLPPPARFLTYAAVNGTAVATKVSALGASLILYDTFAVIGPVVARLLGLPYVNVCAGHDAEPLRTIAAVSAEISVLASPAFETAVPYLHEVLGVEDISPLSFFAQQSPYLNLYCEPVHFISEDTRQSFLPIEYIGSLSPRPIDPLPPTKAPSFRRGADLKIYLSFGTVVWRYFAALAIQNLATFAEVLAEIPNVDVLISLGGIHCSDADRARLQRPNVRVEDYVDQWRVLAEADLFITHCGLNSTHEAIFHQVPMIAYPFLSDQPDMAARCCELGLAVTVADHPRDSVSRDAITRALVGLEEDHSGFQQRLCLARSWELAVIRDRDRIARRIIDIAKGNSVRLDPTS